MHSITVFNAESAFWYIYDNEFRDHVLSSFELYCDSAAISFVSRCYGEKVRRLHGPDFMERYLRANSNARVALIGGSEKAHERIISSFNLSSVFCFNERFERSEFTHILNELDSFNPDIVFFCLGIRRQEWCVHQLVQRRVDDPRYSRSIVIGVGAAVDFLGGTKVRSSLFWQRLGLEWLPRFVREPRMFIRLVMSLIGCFLFAGVMKDLKRHDLTFAKKFKLSID